MAGEAHCNCSSAPWDSGLVDLLLRWSGKLWVLHHSGPHLSWVDLGQIHLHQPHSKVVTPWSQTGVVPDSHSAPPGKPPGLHIVVATTPVIGTGSCKHFYWVCQHSWCQCAPHWIVVCGPQHHSFWHRHMANWYLHLPRSISFQAVSTLVSWQTWWGCMAVRQKTHSHPTARACTIKMNAISWQGFSMSPQAPALGRAVSCLCVIECTWNCVTPGKKLWDPHVALVAGSHRLVLVDRSENSLIVIAICNQWKGISQLDNGSVQMPGGDVGWDAWMSSPSHFGSLLVESVQM